MKRTSSGGMKPSRFVKPPNIVKLPSLWSGIASATNPFANTNFQWHRPINPRVSALNAIRTNTNFHQYRVVNPRISALDAIRRDWDAIGFDMRKVMEGFASKHPEAFPTQGQLFDPESVRDAS
jgi:hypothetical protein